MKEAFKVYRSDVESSNSSSQDSLSEESSTPTSFFDQVDIPTNPIPQEDELKRYLAQPRVDPRLLTDRDINGALGWWKVNATTIEME